MTIKLDSWGKSLVPACYLTNLGTRKRFLFHVSPIDWVGCCSCRWLGRIPDLALVINRVTVGTRRFPERSPRVGGGPLSRRCPGPSTGTRAGAGATKPLMVGPWRVMNVNKTNHQPPRSSQQSTVPVPSRPTVLGLPVIWCCATRRMRRRRRRGLSVPEVVSGVRLSLFFPLHFHSSQFSPAVLDNRSQASEPRRFPAQVPLRSLLAARRCRRDPRLGAQLAGPIKHRQHIKRSRPLLDDNKASHRFCCASAARGKLREGSEGSKHPV